MNVGNSQLFKSFARPILQPHFYAGDGDGPVRQPGIMDAIIQYLINRARLEVSLIRITDATDEQESRPMFLLRHGMLTTNMCSSFSMAIESRVTGTGPMSSTISPVELDLTFNGSCFGRLRLPEVKTSLWGTKVAIQDQTVKILDMVTFKTYIRSVMTDDETCFQLENGECTIRAFGIVAHCGYCLDIPIAGMAGPKATLKTMERQGEMMTLTVTVHNPSPLEMDHGWGRFELRNCEGDTMAELTGDLKIVRGDFDITLPGDLKSGVTPTQKVRLVGMGVDGGSTWCNETIQYFDLVMDLEPQFVDLLQETS